MRAGFPEPPEYGFSWQNLLVEPVSFSGERISLAAVLKTDDGKLEVPKFVTRRKLQSLFGKKYGTTIGDALELCIECVKDHFQEDPTFSDWTPPMQNFYLCDPEYSVASDLEEAVLVAGRHCSSINFAVQSVEPSVGTRKDVPSSRQWERAVKEIVSSKDASFGHCFGSKISLKEGGLKVNVGFVHDNYAAQFDAISNSSAIQNTLLRAQAKLWQLDLLKEYDNLFRIEECELLLGTPGTRVNRSDNSIQELVEELEFEASKRELGVLAVDSHEDMAKHLIEKAAA